VIFLLTIRCRSGSSRATKMATFLESWLESAAGTVKPATTRRYQQMIRDHINPFLGHMSLAKVTPLILQRLISLKVQEGLAPATIGLIHTVVRRALSQAVKWRLLSANPTQGVEVPRRTVPEIKTWTIDVANRFLEATAEHHMAVLWRLALTSGMRQGELLALTWSDINMAKETVAVRRTLTQNLEGEWTVGEPKSAAGRRLLVLERGTIASLKMHKIDQNERRLALGADWIDEDRVFDRGDGSHHNPSTVYTAFTTLCKRADVPVIRFHDLRHTFATISLELGVQAKVVQEALGHSSIAMTMGRYAHVTQNMQGAAAEKLGDVFGNGNQMVTKAS
jgi:integrase